MKQSHTPCSKQAALQSRHVFYTAVRPPHNNSKLCGTSNWHTESLTNTVELSSTAPKASQGMMHRTVLAQTLVLRAAWVKFPRVGPQHHAQHPPLSH